MNWSVALIILAAGFFAWLVLTGLRWIVPRRGMPPGAVSKSSFHAVSIRVRGAGCELARSLSGKRFLADEAPRLPLNHCDRDNCHCAFVHFDDRRRGERRLWVAAAALPDRGERRTRAEGRRIDDHLRYG